MNEEEDGDEELSETEEAWESAKGGEKNVPKNQRKNADLPSTSSAQKRYVTILYLNYYALALAVIAQYRLTNRVKNVTCFTK